MMAISLGKAPWSDICGISEWELGPDDIIYFVYIYIYIYLDLFIYKLKYQANEPLGMQSLVIKTIQWL